MDSGLATLGDVSSCQAELVSAPCTAVPIPSCKQFLTPLPGARTVALVRQDGQGARRGGAVGK